MPEEELAEICMTAISFTNTLDGDSARKRADRRHARFINTAMTATLLGAVSSDNLEDGRIWNCLPTADTRALAHLRQPEQ